MEIKNKVSIFDYNHGIKTFYIYRILQYWILSMLGSCNINSDSPINMYCILIDYPLYLELE